MGKLIVLDHPLIKHKLSILRQKTTGTNEFRKLVVEISALEAYEATRNLELETYAVETPIAPTTGYRLAGKKLAIVPILRAGLGMVDGFVEIIPTAKIGHIGLYRDPQTLKPVEYYCKLPKDVASREIFVLDPMLATGGSAIAAINFLKERGCRSIRMVNILGAPEGIKAVNEAHPDVDIYLAAVDEKLNEDAYIVPGLGDAGDRLFGTK
uniref:uracil phosphoribosyltransferase n=1 Tax=Ndongobacter massiliensis TaxID=1871025 RepID=UPI000931D200|nr:uracil phosphoribosyltransferase [Ndongobacter massiliensis]